MDLGSSSGPPAMLFDLEGTLIDSVYQHVLAWQEALLAFGMDLSVCGRTAATGSRGTIATRR